MSNINKQPKTYTTSSSKPITITHNCYDQGKYFRHSLTVDGEEGLRVCYTDIARNGSYCAVTPYYADYFPEVVKIESLAGKATRKTIQTGSSIRPTTIKI